MDINETKAIVLEKINKIDNSLARFMKKRREKTKVSIMNEVILYIL